jgi:hypothetical protein
MISNGEKGYMEATEKILKTASKIKNEIKNIPDLYILGDPLWNIAFGSKTLDVYKIMEQMSEKNWSLNGLHNPPCLHICVTLRHTLPNIAQKFISDLKSAVQIVKNNPEKIGNVAPIYGMAATFPDRKFVKQMLDEYLDILYKI